jgi:diguanylate cyclase
METLGKATAVQPAVSKAAASATKTTPPGRAGSPSPAMVAKGALRRLAQAQQEPTPENYARAYAEEAGLPAPEAAAAALAPAASAGADPRTQGVAWAGIIERIARQIERGGRQWTSARRKDSLQRVLSGSRSDANRLLQRLQSLVTAWETDRAGDPADTGIDNPPADADATDASAALASAQAADSAADTRASPQAAAAADACWPPVVEALQTTVRAGLDPVEPRAAALADELAVIAGAIASDGATAAHVQAVQAVCDRVRRLFAHRHHLVDQLSGLCRELAQGLTDLAEDDSWARGQCESLQARLASHDEGSDPAGSSAAGLSVRSVRAATELLAETRQRQHLVRGERQAAQDAIKALIQRMISEAGELGDQAGRFQHAVGQHAQAIATADSLESLGDVVRAMLDDSRAVQSAVSATRERLHGDQARAQLLEARVRELEGELRRLSDEVATDALTQVSNRRGLAQAFETLVGSSARDQHDGQVVQLAVGLLDIDNFKKLNDSLGHAAGDMALKSLAAAVRERLRPVDHLARFGGEEFVVLLPATPLPEAQQALTRLQRGLSAGLFMHEGKEVFVTFSAGVTAWQPGETLQAALERADEALYEAKRTGKNRTCMA